MKSLYGDTVWFEPLFSPTIKYTSAVDGPLFSTLTVAFTESHSKGLVVPNPIDTATSAVFGPIVRLHQAA